MKSLIARLLSFLLLAMLLAATALATDTTANFKVTGMVCDACTAKIEKALTKTDGVKSVKLDVDSSTATVAFDDAKVKPEQLIKVFEKQGFKAELQK